MKTINCRGNLFVIDEPKVMGILNITPDSFYSESRAVNEDEMLAKVSQMVEEGVDILDIGAMTSKPGSPIISIEEEVSRLRKALTFITPNFPNLLLSIDTFRSDVIKQILDYPIHIINDITGGKYDNAIFETCANNNLPYIMMHMQGLPETMQEAPKYEDVTLEVLIWLRNQVKKAADHGLNDIIIDPGFGFGKTIDHNFKLVKDLDVFKILERPILVGFSRKSMIYKTLNTTPDSALNGTSALNMHALDKGADILRVHDVKEAKEVIKLWKLIK